MNSDCLVFDISMAQLFSDNGNLGINVTISMVWKLRLMLSLFIFFPPLVFWIFFVVKILLFYYVVVALNASRALKILTVCRGIWVWLLVAGLWLQCFSTMVERFSFENPKTQSACKYIILIICDVIHSFVPVAFTYGVNPFLLGKKWRLLKWH